MHPLQTLNRKTKTFSAYNHLIKNNTTFPRTLPDFPVYLIFARENLSLKNTEHTKENTEKTSNGGDTGYNEQVTTLFSQLSLQFMLQVIHTWCKYIAISLIEEVIK